ncbi:MAG: ABC transporter ATP-binding protein, partial [Anaerolineae bacterium]|nr:ABC transporter ATP-binding protein [Anaerolineae bacterium]
MKPRLKKFLAYYQPYRKLLLTDLACAFIVSAISLVLPLCARYITQNLLNGDAPDALQPIYTIGALMLLLVVIQSACALFVDYWGHMMGALMERDMRSELFDHYQKLSFRFYDEHKTGQLMARISHDLLSLSEFYHHGPEDLAIAVFTLIGVLAIAFTINVALSLIVLLFALVMLIYALYFSKQMNRAIARSMERISDINTQVEDTLAGIRVVQSFTNEPLEQQKFARENSRFVESRRDDYRSSAFFSGGMTAFVQFMTIAVIVFGGVSILHTSLTLPDLLTYLLYVGILLDPIKRLANFARLYQEGVTGFNRFMDILEIEPDIQDAAKAIDLAHVRGKIEFRDVSFRYRDGHDDVLKHICLDIDVGEYVALVGTSGVGKTTLCSLIPRFYEVNAGEILLDGTSIRDIRLASLRRQIGVVQQDVYLFAGSIADNIRYGK